MGEQAKPVVNFMEVASHIIFKSNGLRYELCTHCRVWCHDGYHRQTIPLEILPHIPSLLASFFSLFMLWMVLIMAGFFVIRKRIFPLIKAARNHVAGVLYFQQRSRFPKTMTILSKFGCSEKIVFCIAAGLFV